MFWRKKEAKKQTFMDKLEKHYILTTLLGIIVVIIILVTLDSMIYKKEKIQNAKLININKCYNYNKHNYKNVYYLYKFETKDKDTITLMIDENKPEFVDKLKKDCKYTIEYRGKTNIVKDVYPKILSVEEEK